MGIGYPISASRRLAGMELRERIVVALEDFVLLLCGVTWVRDTKGWYFANTRRKRGRVAAALPMIIPRPGSTEERMASSAVASIKKG